jgi:hypothetical protein
MQNFDHNIGFWEKRQFFRQKLAKIAEYCDHNIDPWCTGITNGLLYTSYFCSAAIFCCPNYFFKEPSLTFRQPPPPLAGRPEIFAYWTILYFRQCFENYRRNANFWSTFFHGTSYALILTTFGQLFCKLIWTG